MRIVLAALAAGVSSICGINCAEAITLDIYSGTGTPASQGWLTLTTNPATNVENSSLSAPVNLNTTANNITYAGYSNYNLAGGLVNPSFPTLDRTAGYTLNFNVRINSEVHDGLNGFHRAGFSVIAISNDKRGIELGFWSNKIWAQNLGFTRGEGTGDLSGTLASLSSYALTVQGDRYTLRHNGINLLSGWLRDYANHPPVSTPPLDLKYQPYRTSNLIFLGDDTTSAKANIDLGAVSLATPVPFEFSPTLGLLILGSCAVVGQIGAFKKKIIG